MAKTKKRAVPLTHESPIFKLIGAGSSEGRGPGSSDKYAYLKGR